MRNEQMDTWLVEALGVARTLLNAATADAQVGAPVPKNGSAGSSPTASETLLQPIAADCRIVTGKVPGPANFVLCKTHGHVLDTDKKQIVARNVDEFLTLHPEFRRSPPAGAGAPAPATAAPTGSKTPDKPTPAAPPVDATAIAAQIDATLTDLDAQSKRLKDDGIPSEPLDKEIAGLRSRLASLTKSGATAKQMAALQAAAASALDRLKTDADRQADATTVGSDKAIQDLRDAAAKQIDKLDADNAEKAPLLAKLKDLDAQIKDLKTATDARKQGTTRQAADKAAQDLLQAAAAAGGNSKEAQKGVQEAYKKALEQKYGISIGKYNTLVTEHTHLDQVYKMFEQVPVGHVVHDKLKDLSYNKRLMVGEGKDRHGIGLYTSASIQLGDYGSETWPYKDPNTGKLEKPNGFSISVLHELGHSVDARWGIMDKHQSEKGCGGWQWHRAGDLAQEIANDFVQRAGGAVPADAAKQIALAALSAGKIDKAPDGVDPGGFKKLGDHLAPWIKARKGYGAAQDFGERKYFARGDSWLSYLSSERAALQVTAYQWSAPAEWFAELYAISWYKGEPGPASVHQSVRAYLPQGKGGGGPGAPGSPAQQSKGA
jgi:hypothetical protein